MKNLIKIIILSLIVFQTPSMSAQTNGTLTFTATTINQFGERQPKNIMAIWVTNSTGTFVKTLKKMAAQRVQYLYQWKANSASNVTDAITGSTLPNHETHTVTWNCKNVSQVVVPDGDYKIWVEFTDGNMQGPVSSFLWTKSATPQTLSPTSPTLSGVSLTWSPIPAGVLENNNINDFSVYPNPFSNNLYFSFINGLDLKTIDIYDINGRKVAHLENNKLTSANNIIIWDGTSFDGVSLKNGIYFYQINSATKKHTGKIQLIK